jgi:hypothetical protein
VHKAQLVPQLVPQTQKTNRKWTTVAMADIQREGIVEATETTWQTKPRWQTNQHKQAISQSIDRNNDKLQIYRHKYLISNLNFIYFLDIHEELKINMFMHKIKIDQ